MGAATKAAKTAAVAQAANVRAAAKARQRQAVAAAEEQGERWRASVAVSATPRPRRAARRAVHDDDGDFEATPETRARATQSPPSTTRVTDDINITTGNMPHDYEALESEREASDAEPWVDKAEMVVGNDSGSEDGMRDEDDDGGFLDNEMDNDGDETNASDRDAMHRFATNVVCMPQTAGDGRQLGTFPRCHIQHVHPTCCTSKMLIQHVHPACCLQTQPRFQLTSGIQDCMTSSRGPRFQQSRLPSLRSNCCSTSCRSVSGGKLRESQTDTACSSWVNESTAL